MDPNLKNFAVFINSASSVNKTTQKSNVQIPFTGNLAPSDATKALSVVLSQFRFTNSIYNIDETKNTLRIACEFAPGRGYKDTDYTRLWETWTVRVPPGTYNTEQLVAYLSLPGSIYPETNTGSLKQYINKVGYESISQRFEYAAVPGNLGGTGNPAVAATSSFVNVFAGFGAIPADPTDPTITPGVVTADNGTRTIFRSPDLSHLIQYGTDITTPCVNILSGVSDLPTNSSLDFSYVYKGIYLLFDQDTEGLLKIMGFYNIDRIPAPIVAGYRNNQGLRVLAQGYGIVLEAYTVYKPFPQYTNGVINPSQTYDSATMRVASENTTYYRVSAATGETQGIIEVPDFPTPVGFQGYFYGAGPLPATSVVMYVQYQANTAATDYVFLDPGEFISGSGVSVPNPYIVNFIETKNILAATSSTVGDEAKIFISQATFDANNGYGLTIGSPITLDNSVTPFDPVNSLFQYYVTAITLVGAEYEITLDHDLPAPLLVNLLRRFMTSVYTLNSPQQVTNLIGTYTNWVSTLLSLNDRTGRLVPNLLTNLEGVGEIHIHCAQLRTQYFSSVNFQSLAPSDVICVVPVDAAFGSAQTFQPPVVLVAYLTNVNIVTLDIQLTNAAGTLLDFNGLDWSMVLKCEEVEIMSEVEQNTSGTMNTVFQDQLASLESTAHSQVRMQRHKNKRLLPYQFFENNETHRKIGNSFM
jgi:hypothetical protein